MTRGSRKKGQVKRSRGVRRGRGGAGEGARLPRHLTNKDSQGPLGALQEAAEQRRRIEAELPELVAAARATGASWGAIGQALGVSREAAWKRYRGPSTT